VELSTRHFGAIEIDPDKVLSFPGGLIGIENAHRFALFSQPELEPFHWLQCVDRPDLVWVVVPVQDLDPGYRLCLTTQERGQLHLREGETPLCLGLLTIPARFADATLNLLAPLVINERERLGAQIINEGQGYTTRHRFKDEPHPTAKEGETHAGADAQKGRIAAARK
jgi:flagellar assembly factor FliW